MHDVPTRTPVFISYSRKDLAAARRLRDQLDTAGLDAYLDVHDIVKGEPWQARLRGLIESADAVVFLVSPDSVASAICTWEINEAELREKRIFPVVVRDTPTGSIPQRLQRLNFAFLDSDARWESEGPLLLNALREDAEWVREHTRLGELALRWDRAGQPARLLLRGADVSAAERWRDRRAHGAPELTTLHNEFLRASRLGVQRRLRGWMIGATTVALLAVVLSTYAYRQRDLAVHNGALAERRAAALATDLARARAQQGAVNEGLLMLLDASTRYPPGEVPEKLLLTLHDVTAQAHARRSFWFSSRARAFHLEQQVAVFDPQAGAIFVIDPHSRDRRHLADYDGEAIAAVAGGGRLVFLDPDMNLFAVSLGADDDSRVTRLATLQPGQGAQLVSPDPPGLGLSSDGDPVGERVVHEASSNRYRRELWRYRADDGALEITVLPDGIGQRVRVDAGFAYFWSVDKKRVQRIGLGGTRVETVALQRAVELGLSPCEQASGTTPAVLLAALYKAMKPGFQGVSCAGVYGGLALVRSERALARGLIDDYFLLPAGADEQAARERYRLQEAIDRLGSPANQQRLAWYRGSAAASLLVVAHANRVMVLGPPDGQFVDPSLYADSDKVVREIETPDETDGGGLYGDSLLTFSGRDGSRYRVSLLDLAFRPAAADGRMVDTRPRRHYRGSCGVQRAEQGANSRVDEQVFRVLYDGDGSTRIDLGDRKVRLPVGDIRCASVAPGGDVLAVVTHDSGVTLYDLAAAGDGDTLAERERIADPSIETVSFAAAQDRELITTHPHKITAWRRAPDGRRSGEIVFRDANPVLFAEADPQGRRLLVWLGMGTADAMVRVVALPAEYTDWLQYGPFMLVSEPDFFFAADGALYSASREGIAEWMPAVTLQARREAALAAMSPACRPVDAADYRSSPCWPAGF